MAKTTSPPFVTSLRSAIGNVSQDSKNALAKAYGAMIQKHGFANAIASRLEATELDVLEKPEEKAKREAKVVFEIDVTDDMCNFGNNMHGGCTAYLIDLCSSVALSLLASQIAPERTGHVSLVINTVYHAPAPSGCRLKVVNTTVAFGGRVMSARTEIYDKTNGRLVASGVHVKMPPSKPKL